MPPPRPLRAWPPTSELQAAKSKGFGHGAERKSAALLFAHLEPCRADRAGFGDRGGIQSFEFVERGRHGGADRRARCEAVFDPELRSGTWSRMCWTRIDYILQPCDRLDHQP